LLKRLDRVFHRNEDAGHAGEDLGHEERLRKETLNLSGTVNSDAVFFRKFVKTKNGDDVLQFFGSCRLLTRVNLRVTFFTP